MESNQVPGHHRRKGSRDASEKGEEEGGGATDTSARISGWGQPSPSPAPRKTQTHRHTHLACERRWRRFERVRACVCVFLWVRGCVHMHQAAAIRSSDEGERRVRGRGDSGAALPSGARESHHEGGGNTGGEEAGEWCRQEWVSNTTRLRHQWRNTHVHKTEQVGRSVHVTAAIIHGTTHTHAQTQTQPSAKNEKRR